VAATYTTPGVYIEEIPAIGPLQGVGTSTPAFIGPALQGPTNTPVKITNWTQFRDTFGGYMIGPPRFYMAYAVKGFFDNGGTVAYIVRVGTGVRAFRDLLDRGGNNAGNALHVEAQQEGPAGNNIQIAVQDAQIVPLANGAVVHKDQANIVSGNANLIILANPADNARFRPGDTVTIVNSPERVIIDRIVGPDLFLQSNLTAAYGQGVVRIADLAVNQTTFRVDNNAGLEPGSCIQIAQGNNNENLVVNNVAADFITTSTGLTNAYAMDQNSAAVTIQSFEFTLIVNNQPNAPENFPNLSMDTRHSRFWGRIANSVYVNFSLPQVPSVQRPPNNRPAAIALPGSNLQNGAADNPAALGLNQYNLGLAALVPILDVELICVPDRTDQGVQQAVITHCETLQDRFAILDAARGLRPDASQNSPLMTQLAWCRSVRGFASLYYPWISINDPSSQTGNDTLLIPPSGHLAGIYARVDAQRGVHKAPANELIAGAIGLEVVVDSVTQGQLNIAGLDVLRVFPGEVRPNVWGARTTAPPDQTAWRYNCVRRLFIFVETTLKYGLRPYVFEPNDLTLWKKLNRTITEFLTRVWRSGALFGAKASEAFYVKIDEELNPPAVRALGEVFIEIGMAPVRPAEFIIVRIGIWDGGASISEQ